tara:strand:+ start:394 stop:690 length:297 start_codon:yes stop_codon:yes gene_type:complete
MDQHTKHEQIITTSTGDYLRIRFASYASDHDEISLTDRETDNKVIMKFSGNHLQGTFIETIGSLKYSRSEAKQAFLNQIKSTVAEVEEYYKKEIESNA